MGHRIVGAAEFHDFAVGVLDHLLAFDDIGVFEADFAAGAQAEVFLRGVFHEVGPVDQQFAREGDAALGALGIGGIERGLEPFHTPGFPIGERQFDRVVIHNHVAVAPFIEVLADTGFQSADIHQLVALAHADAVAEQLEGFGRIAAAADAAEGRHPGVVPAGDEAFLHQLEQLALAHQGIGQVETGEFVLMRGVDAQRLDEPVVKRTVDVELQRADGVRDMFDGVALAVGVVVHRIDAPLVAGAVVMGVLDAVEDRIAEHHVWMRHVDLGPEHFRAVRVLARLHFTEETEILLDGTVPPGAVGARRLHGAAVGPHFFEGLVVHVGQAALDELLGPFVELVEIVGSVALLRPLEAQPFDVFLDGIDILHVFLGRIGVVVAEIRLAAVFLGKAEIDTQALGMAQMKIAVGLRREAGDDAVVFSGREVRLDNLFEEIVFLLFFHISSCFKPQIY